MRSLGFTTRLAAALTAVLLAGAAPAWAVSVTCGTGSGLAGQDVDITVSTADLAGLGVTSFQFQISYPANLVTAIDVLEAGTLPATAGWSDATFGVTTSGPTGRISVSHAGSTALSGAGALVRVRFTIDPAQLSATTATLTLQGFTFNEGTPPATTTNGSISIGTTPVITVSPASGEVIRGATLQFTVSGPVTNPVSWFTTDPAVATISASGLLTGVSAGSVKVFAVDAAARRDTTNGDVLVRGMGVTMGSGSVLVNQSINLPVTVTSLDGLGIRAGQISVQFDPSRVTPTGVLIGFGTLLNGWGPTAFGVNGDLFTIDFVGSTDLVGAGTLCVVTFQAAGTSGSSALTVRQALFNETLPAKTTNGSVTVSPLPTITVAPDVQTLLVGQTRQYSVSGSVTNPVLWSVLDPTIASVSGSGLVTALKGGVTKVRAVDNVGATDESQSLTVYDFQVTVATVTVPPGGATARVPLRVDRDLSALDIRSIQYAVLFDGARIADARSIAAGLVSPWAPGGLVSFEPPARVQVATAGIDPLGPGNDELHVLEFDVAPGVPAGTDIALSLSGFLCNEGSPWALPVNGVIRVRSGVDAPAQGPAAFGLAPCAPHPVRGQARFAFSLPAEVAAGDAVELALFDLAGRRVCTLARGPQTAGEHHVVWDGRTGSGAPVAPGLYLCRLTWRGRALERKVVVAR